MKNNILKFVLAASLILNLSVFATAGYHYYQQSRYSVSPYGGVMEKDRFLFEDLSLSPEQLAAMKDKAKGFHADIDRHRMEIDKKRNELIALIRFDNPDQRSIDAAIRAISGKQEEIQRMIAMHMLEVKAILDKSQQQKFLDLIESTMAKSGHRTCPS